MKKSICIALSLMLIISLIMPVSAKPDFSYYIFTAESFSELGSWYKTGSNSGSPETLILRHDSGSDSASLTFKTGSDRYWNIYIHTRDFDTSNNRSFAVGIDGNEFPTTVGNHGNNGWMWELAAKTPLLSGEHTLSLIPKRSYSRCDYILVTDDITFNPDSIENLSEFKKNNLYSDDKVVYPEYTDRPEGEFAVLLNGKYITLSNHIYMNGNSVMLPCADVLEASGLAPVFNTENHSLVVPEKGYTIEAVSGSDSVLFRGNFKTMSEKAEMNNGVLYVPIDFFDIALKGISTYDDKSKTIKLLYDENDIGLFLTVDNFLLNPGTWYKDSDGTFRSNSVNKNTAVAANATFEIDIPGTYTLHIKSFDNKTSPGSRFFHAILDGTQLETKLGQHGNSGHAWTKLGKFVLDKGTHTLGLYNTSGSPHARFSGAFLTLDENKIPPEENAEILGYKVPDSSLELSDNASYPVWAKADGTVISEESIENNHVKLNFIAEKIGDKTVIKTEFYLKTENGLKLMKSKNENNGFLMLYAEKSEYNGRSKNFEANNKQTINSVTGTAENYYKQGEAFWHIPCGISKIGNNEIMLTFPESDASLTATYSLDDLTTDPKVTLNATFKKEGAYSFVLANGNSVSENDYDSVTAPFFYVKKAVPDTAGALPESYLFTPMATLETDGISEGIAVDPTSVRYGVIYPGTSLFGLLLRAPDGGVQPQFAAPLFGTEHSAFKENDNFEISFRLIYNNDWFETFKHVTQNLYNLKDIRTNEYTTSLNDAIYNTTDLMMDDFYGGFDDNSKSFYNMEAPDVVTLANASEVIQRYLLTENDEILTERAIPTLEFILTRNSHFNAGTTASSYTPEVPLTIGTPLSTPPAATFLGISNMAGGRIPYLESYALTKTDTTSNAKNVQNYAYLYEKTGNEADLESMISYADAMLLNTRNYKTFNGSIASTFNFTEYIPELSAFVTAYEHTYDEKYLTAAENVAQLLSTALWTTGYHNGFDNEDITITPDDLKTHHLSAQNYDFFWHGSEKFRPGYSLNEKGNPAILDETLLYTRTLPKWTMSRAGMGTEQKVSCVNGVAITMNTWAGLFIKMSEYTGDKFYETLARNAIIGRFSNYNGYGHEMLAPHTLDADYPIKGPDITSLYYHHIPPFLAMLEDFLITSIWAKSDRNIEFPSFVDTGYAYFSTRQYGHAPGKFYDEQNMWLWLDRGIVTSSSTNTDYIAAKKDGVLALAFVNEANASETVTLTLGEKVPCFTGSATLYNSDGTKSSIEIENGVFSLDIPAKGLKSVVIKSDEISAPAHSKAPITIDSSTTSSVHTGGKGYVLQFDNSKYFAYTYITDLPDKVTKATLTYTAESETKTLTDDVYPYEFTVEIDSPYTSFEYEITATLTDGSTESRGTATLRPINYTEFPEITDFKSNGGLISVEIGNSKAIPESSQLFIGLFDSKNALLQSSIETVDSNTQNALFKSYNPNFATAKLFLWNNMRPLCASPVIFKNEFNGSWSEFEPFSPAITTVGRTGTHWRIVVALNKLPFEISENSLTGMPVDITFTPKNGGEDKIYSAYVSSNEMRDYNGTVVIVVPESQEFPTSDEWAVNHTQSIKLYPY